MEWQWLANGLFVIVGALLGILYSNVKREIMKQDELLAELTGKVHEIDKLVAGDYVRKADLEKTTDALFRKLDQICEKIDRKADK